MGRHIFHHQERLALAGAAAIDQPGDGRMVELCENLTLAAETIQKFCPIHAMRHDFDRHILPRLVVVTQPR